MRRNLATWLALALASLACGAESVSVPNDSAGSETGGSGGSAASGAASGAGASGSSGATAGSGGTPDPGLPRASGASGASGTSAIEPPPEETGEPAPRTAVPCGSPRARPTGGGYLDCADGSVRRPEIGECVSHLPYVPDSDTRVGDECEVDSDCGGVHDYCEWGLCQHGCIADSECGASQICLCEEPVGRCVPALCASDADCPADFPCSGTFGNAWSGFVCQAPDDECFQDDECRPFGQGRCDLGPPRTCALVVGN